MDTDQTHREQASGKFVVEVSYDRDVYGKLSHCERFEEPEQAAQHYESEAEPPKCELAQLVEELATGEKLESVNGETGRRVIAYELVEAVV